MRNEYQYVHYKTREEKELRKLCSENNVRIVTSTLGNDGYWKSRIEGDFDNVHKVSNLWKNLQFNRPALYEIKKNEEK